MIVLGTPMINDASMKIRAGELINPKKKLGILTRSATPSGTK
jgi:hypothetical protein